jgi:hypothetical protein
LKNGVVEEKVLPLAVTDGTVGIDIHDPAEWEIVNRYEPGSFVSGITYRFKSRSSYYDKETHYALGNYLRYLENLYDLNVMSLYNCFGEEWVYSFTLNDDIPTNVSNTQSLKEQSKSVI